MAPLFRSTLPQVAGGQLLDKALEAGGTVEYRTGFILPDPKVNMVSSAAEIGWEAWLRQSNATTTGFPVGNGFVKIKHTTIVVPSGALATCDEYEAAARRLVDEFQVGARLFARAYGSMAPEFDSLLCRFAHAGALPGRHDSLCQYLVDSHARRSWYTFNICVCTRSWPRGCSCRLTRQSC